jgi:hypothetical protein
MRLRSIVTGLVAVFLLAVTCVANACEISCNVTAPGPGCHNASIASAAPAMVGIHDCGMNMGRNSAQVQANGLCKHSVCEQQPQITASDQTLVHAQSITGLHAFISAFIFPTKTQNVALGRVDTSPERVLPLVALHPVLRV